MNTHHRALIGRDEPSCPSVSTTERIDTERLRQQHPIAEVVERYGIDLRRSGSALVGRCPFHPDAGRPNLVVFPRSARFVCFRCQVRGDAIAFIQQIEQLSFRDAAQRLDACAAPAIPRIVLRRGPDRAARQFEPKTRSVPLLPRSSCMPIGCSVTDARSSTSLAAALREMSSYSNASVSPPATNSCPTWRGATCPHPRPGALACFAPTAARRWRVALSSRKFASASLYGSSVACSSPPTTCRATSGYLVPSHCSGWDQAIRDRRGVCIVEGPFDLLALQQWDVPGLALCGTGFSPTTLQLLGQWERMYAVLDADAAGQEATTRLIEAFGSRVIPVQLPPGMKDPADLASLIDGGALLQEAIRQAVDRHRWAGAHADHPARYSLRAAAGHTAQSCSRSQRPSRCGSRSRRSSH